MKIWKNIFNAGVDKDTAKSKYPNNKAYHLENFRILSDDKQGNGDVTNIKGTDSLVDIPNANAIIKVTKANLNFTSWTASSANIELDNGTVLLGNLAAGTGTLKDHYNAIINEWTSNPNFASLNVKAWISENDMYVTSLGGNIADVFPGSSGYTTSIYISQQTNLRVIGSTTMRDDVILFTTNDTSTSGGPGQIWKLTYNEDSYGTNNIELIYHNNLNFSKEYPIEAASRYENTQIQRIYWTDFFSPLRSLNIADSDTFGLTPDDLEGNTDLPLFQFQLESIQDGGTLKEGSYFFAYSLKSSTKQTVVSSWTGEIQIVGASEAATHDNYHRGLETVIGAADKSITFSITADFSDYDQIVIYRAMENYGGTVYHTITSMPVPSVGKFTYTHTGAEDNITSLDLGSVLDLSPVISKCKTIAIKDNRLLIANIVEATFLDTFDARAYRYKKNSNTTHSDPNTNPYNKLSTRDLNNDQQYKYKKNSTVLGGTGVNIDFRFNQTKILLQNNVSSYKTYGVLKAENNGDPDIVSDFPIIGNHFPNYKSPYFCHFARGYKRGEVYRFGIQFFTKSKKPLPVKWIADIRMPDNFDSDIFWNNYGSIDDGSTVQFNNMYAMPLCVEFTVRIPNSIKEKIGGFSIVRSPRRDSDKTILGQCRLQEPSSFLNDSPSFGDDTGSSNQKYHFDSPDFKFTNSSNNTFPPAPELDNENGSSFPLKLIPIKTYVTRNVVIDENQNRTTDILTLSKAIEIYKDIREGGTFDNTTSRQNIIDVKKVKKLPVRQSTSSVLGDVIEGIGHEFEVDTSSYTYGMNNLFAIAEPTLYQQAVASGSITNEGQFLGYLVSESASGTLIDFETRSILFDLYRETESYGGTSATAIGNTSYINIGHFQKIDKDTTASTFNTKLYGGDTYITMYYDRKANLLPANNITAVISYAFPLETSVNTEHRYTEIKDSSGNTIVSGANNLGEHSREYYIGPMTNINDGFYQIPSTYKIDHNSITTEASVMLIPAYNESSNTTDTFDNRAYISDMKTNGELLDKWRIFQVNNNLDVDGDNGPITKVITHNNNVYFFQDDACGIFSINPRTLVTDTEGTQLELGVGGILHDFQYISNSIGTRNQWSVIKSNTSVYFFDSKTMKLYRLKDKGSPVPVTDIKGMFTYINSNINPQKIKEDNPLKDKGICGVFDKKYNEIWFTFHQDVERTIPSFTMIINENLDVFTGFYSHTPPIYIGDGKNIISPSNVGKLYIHDKGDYGKFYDTYYPSKFTLLINPKGDTSKVLDVIEYLSNVTDNNGNDVYNETLSTIRIYNEYQDSGTITLTPGTNIKRKFRTWRFNKIRDYESGNIPVPRIRNPYFFVDATYTNAANKRIIISGVDSYYKESPI